MTRNLLLSFIFVTLIALGHGATNCTEKNGFMYCEDVSSQGQSFLNKREEEDNYTFDVCLDDENDKIYGIVSQFDFFCFDEIYSSSDFSIKGRMAAKNSINSKRVAINTSQPEDCSTHSLKYAIYTDKLEFEQGSINGGIHYGSELKIPEETKNLLNSHHCTISKDGADSIDFNTIEKGMNEISENLARMTPNSQIEVTDGELKITLQKDVKNYVINADGGIFKRENGGYSFQVIKPEDFNIDLDDVTILINVSGSSFTIANAGYKNENNVPKALWKKFIWNAPQATEINIQNVDIYGLLLAPKAVVNFKDCQIEGKVISKSLKVSQFYITSSEVTGCIPSNANYKTGIECNVENVESKEINSDILFIFDESISMCTYIEAMRNKLQDFIDQLNSANANARFSVIGFGGKPRIYTGFTNDVNTVKKAFGKLDCSKGGQESGLEAIRMFLKKSNKFLDYTKNASEDKNFEDVSKLDWRKDSSKTIILVTDEDSDLPHYSENRNDLQNNINRLTKNVYYYDNRSNRKMYYSATGSDIYFHSYNEGEEINKETADKYIGFPVNLYEYPYYSQYEYDRFFEPAFSPAKLMIYQNTVHDIHNNAETKNVLTFYRTGSPLV
ncbi:hypothetical protein BCR32DRAFT_137965, partial [Anaeromyces robustus]